MEQLIRFSVKQRWLVLALVALVIGWGVVSLQRLPVDAIPDITNKQVNVITLSPNLGPNEIEKFVTVAMEMEMSNIPGLEEIRSISKFGLSSVTLVFSDETDLYWARSQVFERLATIKESLVEGAGNPQLAPVTTGIGEVYQYVLEVDEKHKGEFSLLELRSLQDWIIRKNLLGTEGIADISSFGGFKKEYQAQLKPDRMRALNVSVEELYDALKAGNANTGGAYIEKSNRAYIIRGEGLTESLSDVEETVVKEYNGQPVLIRDVADVRIGSSLRNGAMTMDGEGEVVGAVVLMQMGSNAQKVVRGLKAKLAEVEKQLPEGVKIKPFIDREDLVNRTIQTVTKNLLEGAIVVFFVLFVLLGDIRASLIAASVIPVSLLFAFGWMVQTGVIGNLMSLGAIDFGLIVDGAVIIVEGVVLGLSNTTYNLAVKSQREEALIKGAFDSRKSVFFGTLIILVVYAPILFLSGVEGKMFRPMAMTVSYCLIGALIMSFTLVPALTAFFLKPHDHKVLPEKILDNFYYNSYRPLLMWLFRRPWIIFPFLVSLMVGGYLAFSRIGGEFIPRLDEGIIQIETRLPVGSSLTQSIALTTELQKEIKAKFPDEVLNVVGKIGTSEIPLDPVPMEQTDLIITLKPKEEWVKAKSKDDLINGIMEIYATKPGVIASVQQPIEGRFNDLLSGAKTDIVFKIFGNDLDKMVDLANQVAGVLKKVPGSADVQVQQLMGSPQVRIKYLRHEMSIYGITVQQVNNVVETAFAGKAAGYIYEDDRRYDLVVRLPNKEREDPNYLENLQLRDANGKIIPLKQVADIEWVTGAAEIRRTNKQRVIQIGVNARGRDMESLVNEAEPLIREKVSLPYGYSMVVGGQFENLAMAKGRLAIVVPIALLVILGLLFMSFGTVKESLLVFSAVPMSAVGGIFSLMFADLNFSISAGVGFICLFGIAVLNGLMLVGEFQENLKQEDQRIAGAILRGVKTKFRPVLMTSAVAALGFLPMALASGAGAEVQKPLAIVVMGGIATSTILTLLGLPLLYWIFSGGVGGVRKGGKSMAIASLLIGLFLFAGISSAIAQQSNDGAKPKRKRISVDSAVAITMRTNPNLQAAEGIYAQQKVLLPSALNLPGAEVIWQAPTGRDFRPQLLLRTEFPGLYLSQYKQQKTNIHYAETWQDNTQNDMIYQLLSAYYNLQYLDAREKMLRQQDSILFSILDVNETRYRIGSITNLEKMNGEARYRRLKQKVLQNRAQLRAERVRFNNLLGFANDTTYNTEVGFKMLPAPNLKAIAGDAINDNPRVELAQVQAEVQERQVGIERMRALPGLVVGYFNQDDPATPIQNNLQFGFTFPLSVWASASKVKGAKLGLEVAKKQIEAQRFDLRNQYLEALAAFRQHQEALTYFDEAGLRQAVETLKSSTESYQLGSISYVGYLLNMQEAFEIEQNYLESLHYYNQAVVRLNYLTGVYARKYID